MLRRLLSLALLPVFAIVYGLLIDHPLIAKLTESQPYDDLVQYLDGAARLVTTGTPYLPIHLDPSITPPPSWEFASAYVYSPLMAQLLVPFVAAGPHIAWYAWSAASLIALTAGIALAARAAGRRLRPHELAIAVVLLVAARPITSALWHGRPEPFAAAAVAVALAGVGGSLGAAIAAVVAGLFRLTTAAFALPLVVAATSRPRALGRLLIVALVVVAACALFAPTAWWDYLPGGALLRTAGANALPMLYDDAPHAFVAFLGLSSVGAAETYQTAADFAMLPASFATAVLVLRAVEALAGLALVLWSVRLAGDPRRRHAAFGASLFGTLLFAGMFWDYHIVVLLPVAVAAFVAGSRQIRLALAFAYLAALVPNVAIDLRDIAGGGAFYEGLIRVVGAVTTVPLGIVIVEAARRTRLPGRAPRRRSR